MDPGPQIPSGTTVLADRITDAASVIPNHMGSSIGRHPNPGPIIETIFGENLPRPLRACVLAGADREANSFQLLDIERHGDEVKSVVGTGRQIDVRVANRAIR